MTARIDRQDSYLRELTATITQRLDQEESPAIILDRSLFYAEGGGQAADTGRVWPAGDEGAAARVLSATLRGEEVVLRLDRPLPASAREVVCALDWERRFDHMQQHTGQHIFSAALHKLLGAETRSSRLGAELSTIDLDRELSAQALHEAEDLANQIVFENRPVRALYPSAEALAALPLRREPKVETNVRVIEVEGFDYSPCGGTHVAHSSEIGGVSLLSSERYKGGTRLSFLAGKRILAALRARRLEGDSLAKLLSAGPGEQAAAVARLQEEAQARLSRLQELGAQLAAEKAAALLSRPEPVLRARLDGEKSLLRMIAQAIAQAEGRAAFLGTVEIEKGAPRGVLLFAAHPGSGVDAGARLKAVCAALGGRGGGRPNLAEGSCPAERLDEALSLA